MFETAKGSWVFTRACLADFHELDVRDTLTQTVSARVRAALVASSGEGARYLVILHGAGETAHAVRAAVYEAVRNDIVDSARCSQFEEGFIAALQH